LEESATSMSPPRGIMRPDALSRVVSLERPAPPDDIAGIVDHHWIVAWDLRGGDPYRSEVLTHPAVHLVFEPHGAFVYGVRRRRDTRILSGAGYAVGTKFLPGGLGGFVDRPMAELTDSVRTLADLFGSAGERLAAAAAAREAHADKLALVHEFLRARRPAAGPEVALVQAVVADMRGARPGTRVEEIAARHAVSSRTLQRLFRRHVGVGPKWVLQRYRLHEALEQLDRGQRTDWTRFALELGYFDQAHFIRDFRAVAGRSPAQYARETAPAAAPAAA
jgi:AraC-like DNA-binding protein